MSSPHGNGTIPKVLQVCLMPALRAKYGYMWKKAYNSTAWDLNKHKQTGLQNIVIRNDRQKIRMPIMYIVA
jgi:hypothetical protein